MLVKASEALHLIGGKPFTFLPRWDQRGLSRTSPMPHRRAPIKRCLANNQLGQPSSLTLDAGRRCAFAGAQGVNHLMQRDHGDVVNHCRRRGVHHRIRRTGIATTLLQRPGRRGGNAPMGKCNHGQRGRAPGTRARCSSRPRAKQRQVRQQACCSGEIPPLNC